MILQNGKRGNKNGIAIDQKYSIRLTLIFT